MQANDSQRLETLCKVATELSHLRSFDRLGELVHDATTELIGADGAVVLLSNGTRCYAPSHSQLALLRKGEEHNKEAAAGGWVMHHHCPAIIPDVTHDSRIPFDLYGPTLIKSIAAVPIEGEEKSSPCGAIESYWTKRHAASSEEVRLLQLLADMTAMGLRSIQRRDELYELVRARTANLEQITRHLFLESQKQQAAEEEAQRLAITDELTGLYNRRGFFRLGEAALQNGRRNGRPVWVLYADINGLKQMNDCCGHEAGDRLLQVAASELRRAMRGTDLIARVGGDEFCAVLTDVRDRGMSLVDKLSSCVDASSRESLPILSVGVVQDDGATTLDQLMNCADQLMYTLKRWRKSYLRQESKT